MSESARTHGVSETIAYHQGQMHGIKSVATRTGIMAVINLLTALAFYYGAGLLEAAAIMLCVGAVLLINVFLMLLDYRTQRGHRDNMQRLIIPSSRNLY